MCKLYALQTTMTKAYARRIIADRSKIILKTESNGLGIALNVDGKTRTWQCGETFADAIGEDVTDGLDDKLRMATLMIHGRTSTSSDHSVDHSHPRPTKFGPLIHNGVVVPIKEDGWKMKYALDSDYLGELADRGELHLAAEYLNGYAAVMTIKDDGTLIVQNQGGSLYNTIQHEVIEFGTTMSLCPGGNKFELLKAEANSCYITIEPINAMVGRITKFDGITNLGVVEEKKGQTSLALVSGTTDGTPKQTNGWSGRTRSEIGSNPKKKGRRGAKPLIDRDFYGSENYPFDMTDIPEYMRNGLTEEEKSARDDFFSDWKAVNA